MKRSADSTFVVERMPSPTPSSSSGPSSPSPDGPPRKRSRSEVTPEERKEARAHRNRIAAQNSRDRRKAQFSYLERRVVELEEENRQLRAGLGVPTSQPAQIHHSDKDLAREKENEELKERIKTLENGWEAVIKALAASGLPLNVPTPLSSSASQSTATASCPVIVPPVYPISPAPSTPSTSSHELDLDVFEPTRHLARVATTDAPLLSSVPQQRVDSQRLSSRSSLTQLRNLSRLQLSPSMRQQQLLSTKALWKISSMRSSRRLPLSHRRPCLMVHPTKSPPSRNFRPPGRR